MDNTAILNEILSRFDKMDARLDRIEDDIAEIKENTEVTRTVVNLIGDWAELAGDVLKVEYPIEKQSALKMVK